MKPIQICILVPLSVCFPLEVASAAGDLVVSDTTFAADPDITLAKTVNGPALLPMTL